MLGRPHRGDVIDIENMVDAMHRACQLWASGGAGGAGPAPGPDRLWLQRGFWQLCQAVAESLLNGNKEKQLLEGLLTGKEGYMRQSVEATEMEKRGGPEQLRLPE